MADYQLHTTKPISATKVTASNFWRKSIQIPSSAIFSTFLLSVWRERRGREFAETFCFVTLTQATIVSVLFLPLLVPFAKETCQTCDNNKSHSYCHFLELFVGHANNLGGKRSDTTAPKKGRWEKPIFFSSQENSGPSCLVIMIADSTSFVILRYLFDNLVTALQKNTCKELGRKQPFFIKTKVKRSKFGFFLRGRMKCPMDTVHMERKHMDCAKCHCCPTLSPPSRPRPNVVGLPGRLCLSKRDW